MAHQNLLRDLLREDQEPFHLRTYMADRPIFYQASSLNLTLCTKSCFKPSLFHSSRKSPCRSATLLLNIPAKTADVLLEATAKIHRHPSKPKTRAINTGFCSYLKRLWDKNKDRKCGDKLEANSEDARLSSAGWSVSNEGKSLDLESSSSTSTYDYTQDADIHSCENKCSSSSQPFCFALQRSSYADHTPEFLSPVASPISHVKQNYHEEGSLQKVEKEEEEGKDQCSPVSVLAPPFQDDHEQHRGAEEDEEDSDFVVECSFANVQRASLDLLKKLRRFERLTELDPVELEKRMLEDHEEDDEEVIVEEEVRNYVNYPESLYTEENLDEVVTEVLRRSNQYDQNKIPSDVKRLLLELIAQERKNGPQYCSTEVIVSRVCKRLNEWKEVKLNTIDMMVELDFRNDVDVWKLYKEEVRDKAREIEFAIFGLLLEELVS